MRAFIAVEVSRFSDLEPLFEEIGSITGSKPVRTEALHMTFVFLGEVDSAGINRIVLSLSSVQMRRFSVEIRGIGCFPGEQRARVVFLNVASNPEIEENYHLIHKSVGPGLGSREPFIPHITIGRFRSPVNLASIRDKYSWIKSDQEIRKVGIFSSRLTPDGPIYRPIAEFQLK